MAEGTATPFKAGRFTRIKDGISQTRRLPRLGKIRLGMKVVNRQGKEYPTETKFFVLVDAPGVAEVYGNEPTELDVMFPVNDPEIIFPQQLEWYGKEKGLKCHGDKTEAMRRQPDNSWAPHTCPCEHLQTPENPRGECTERGHLLVMLPKVSLGGVYQIDTGSYHSIVDVNSGIDMVRATLHGRLAMVPLKLRRVPRETHNDQHKRTHYTLMLTLDASLSDVNALIANSKLVIDRSATIEVEQPQLQGPAADPPNRLATQEEEDEIVYAEQVPNQPGKPAAVPTPAPAPPAGPPATAPADTPEPELDLPPSAEEEFVSPPPDDFPQEPVHDTGPGPTFDLIADYQDRLKNATDARALSFVGNLFEQDGRLTVQERANLRRCLNDYLKKLGRKR